MTNNRLVHADRCPDCCEHCWPDAFHPCVLAPHHDGPHTCLAGLTS